MLPHNNLRREEDQGSGIWDQKRVQNVHSLTFWLHRLSFCLYCQGQKNKIKSIKSIKFSSKRRGDEPDGDDTRPWLATTDASSTGCS